MKNENVLRKEKNENFTRRKFNIDDVNPLRVKFFDN
jgi:hypothetical protein